MNSGTPVDPGDNGLFSTDLRRFGFPEFFDDNPELQRDLFKALTESDGKELKEKFEKIRKENSPWGLSVGMGVNAELRQRLKEQCGNDLREAFYKATELIPDDKWMEFVRRTLQIDREDIKDFKYNTHSTENKIQMLEAWFDGKKIKGKEPTAAEFLDIVFMFLEQRNLMSRLVQQNFYGEITAGTFNGYVNNGPPPVQTSA